jgi:hypothetical protein
MATRLFAMTLAELAPFSGRYDGLEREAFLSRSVNVAPTVIGQLSFEPDELLVDKRLATLCRPGVRVELEEAGSVVLRVSGVADAVERAALCAALIERDQLLVAKCLAIKASAPFATAHLFPCLSSVRWLASASVIADPAVDVAAASQSTEVQHCFLPCATTSAAQGRMVAKLLLRSLRRLFDTQFFLVWFGAPGLSRFSLDDFSDAPKSTRRFSARVEQLYRALFTSGALSAFFAPCDSGDAWTMMSAPPGSAEPVALGNEHVSTAPCAGGFFFTSDVVDVRAMMHCAEQLLRNLSAAWDAMPTIPFGTHQRVTFYDSTWREVVPEDQTLDPANVVVLCAEFESLKEPSAALEFRTLLQRCTRVEVVKVADCGASRELFRDIVGEAAAMPSTTAIVVSAADTHMHAKCVPADPCDPTLSGERRRRAEAAFDVCSLVW